MKKTHSIFILKGNIKNVKKALNFLNGFKGIEVIDSEKTTSEQIKKAFLRNKSIVCRGYENNNMFSLYPTFLINVTADGKVRDNSLDIIGNNLVRKFQKISNKYQVDIGDHITDNIQISDMYKCAFCILLDKASPDKKKILYKSENFSVISGVGAFYEGYLIIIPKKHILSFGELSPQEFDEFIGVVEDIKFLLKKIYNKDILFWENGSGTDITVKNSSSIVHAHGHFLPILPDYDIIETAMHQGVPLNKFSKENLKNFAKNPYLLVITPNNDWYIKSSKEHYIPRQFIRQLLCESLIEDDELWDWRIYPFLSTMTETEETFLKYVKHNFNKLPKRIQERTFNFLTDK